MIEVFAGICLGGALVIAVAWMVDARARKSAMLLLEDPTITCLVCSWHEQALLTGEAQSLQPATHLCIEKARDCLDS